jgi:adenylosuccinate lyase
MDPRYQHPRVTELWSPAWTYQAWWEVERAVAKAQVEQIKLDPDKAEQLEAMRILAHGLQPAFDADGIAEIQRIEGRTRHDVAAFLEYVRMWFGEPHARWIHFGLTSSDVVDTAQGMRFRELEKLVSVYMSSLEGAIGDWLSSRQIVSGRTHGQPAEPISMGMRAAHWCRMFNTAQDRLAASIQDMQWAKTSGPVGNYAHNGPWIESKVANLLGLASYGQGATQIIPRTHLAEWAGAAAGMVQVCAKIALDIRLMLFSNEGREQRPVGQVGSSSMAHKKNPIVAEQIGGMARLAAGYASMLQPLDVWLERDISHSSVERVAVPDLWHVLLRALHRTDYLLGQFQTGYRADLRLSSDLGVLTVHRRTLEAVKGGLPIDEARDRALVEASANPLLDGDGALLDIHYYDRNWEYPERE